MSEKISPLFRGQWLKERHTEARMRAELKACGATEKQIRALSIKVSNLHKETHHSIMSAMREVYGAARRALAAGEPIQGCRVHRCLVEGFTLPEAHDLMIVADTCRASIDETLLIASKCRKVAYKHTQGQMRDALKDQK
jgi:hypothetical protein